jgi:hypothetical protein
MPPHVSNRHKITIAEIFLYLFVGKMRIFHIRNKCFRVAAASAYGHERRSMKCNDNEFYCVILPLSVFRHTKKRLSRSGRSDAVTNGTIFRRLYNKGKSGRRENPASGGESYGGGQAVGGHAA